VTRVGQEPSYREVTRFCVRASDAITVPSVFLRDEARRLFDLDGKIEVIPNFVDTRGFTPPASRPAEAAAPVLVHVSNFRPVKRTTDLIEVLARVRRHLPARLVLIGDGPDRAATEARARDLGVAGATRFVGRRAEIAATLQEADAFLLTSESESFGVAALEAMSCGVPVFGYAVGGLPEVVGEQAGRLVAPHDVAALADAILALLGDREAWRAASTAARERAVGSFGREAILDRYQAFYRRLLARETP
jgi:N-acetyl-alpha-D-glucosaminyl L-malate synthase BshA